MEFRTQTLFSLLSIAVALSSAGCGFNQQSRFQLSFVPATPHGDGGVADIDPPPDVQPNLYLRDVPAFLVANPQLPERRSRADAMVQRAEQKFQLGKRYYQTQDFPKARTEFDAAIDLMLEALDQNPADRQGYESRLEEMVDVVHRADLAGMGASDTVEEGKFEKAPLEDILQMTFPVDPRLKDRVREQVAATVSQLPLSVTDAVLGYINYFSNRGHRTLIAAYQRSGRYRPMIQRILDEEGVPQELIHLAQAESGFMPRAMSRAAAVGMWQFDAWRGRQYGLERTAYTDGRMDPEKATRAAARHLHDLYSEFGDWYLALAAYNCGSGAVEKAVERTGFADFWELRSRGVLPAETTNYVPIILAMTIMEKNAAEYGLADVTLDPPLEYDTVEAASPISLTLVSDITDTPPTELAALNPSLLKGVAPERSSLHVPKGSGKQLIAALQLIPSEHRDSWRLHRVGTGETLASIGKRYGAAPASIVAANSLQSAQAVEGDRLVIPAVLRMDPPARKSSHASTARHSAPVRHAKAKRSSKSTSAKSGAAPKRARKRPVMVAHNAPR